MPALLLETDGYEMAFDFIVPTSLLLLTVSLTNSMFSLSFGIYTCTVLATLIESVFSFKPVLILGFVFCSTCNLITLFPHTFTFGEAVILSQLFAIFVQRSSVFCLAFIIFFLIERYSISFSLDSLLFVSVILIALVLFLYHRLSPTFSLFYSLEVKRLVCYLSVANILLLSFWFILFMVCIALVWISRYLADSSQEVMCLENSNIVKVTSDKANTFPAIDLAGSELKSTTNQSTDELSSSHASRRKSPFWMRKVFHFAAGLVYATGIVWSPGLLSLASVALLLLFITLEWMRRRGVSV